MGFLVYLSTKYASSGLAVGAAWLQHLIFLMGLTLQRGSYSWVVPSSHRLKYSADLQAQTRAKNQFSKTFHSLLQRALSQVTGQSLHMYASFPITGRSRSHDSSGRSASGPSHILLWSLYRTMGPELPSQPFSPSCNT